MNRIIIPPGWKGLGMIVTGLVIIWIPLCFLGAAMQLWLDTHPETSPTGYWAIYILTLVVAVCWAGWFFLKGIDLLAGRIDKPKKEGK